jgi:S-adenosylmethionine:tRNA ribosyltransferase-isomerase
VKLSDFDYELDPARIAQVPATPRDSARLLVATRGSSAVRHLHVRDLTSLLAPGDLLVVNDTRVVAARLFGARASGARVEMLLAERLGPTRWRALVRPAARLKPGERIELEGGVFVAQFLERRRDAEGRVGDWEIELHAPHAANESIDLLLERHGHMPLPQYIAREPERDARDQLDRERYQTVYARESGAIAAPTAGLHFTTELLAALSQRGVELARVTLHVGEGTFKPVEVEDIDQHPMHAENYTLPRETAEAIERTRARRGRVIAVGTTSARTLETCARDDRIVNAGSGSTRLFLKPGVPLRVVDALFTNFHLPRSTLLMLVSAFAGRERTLELYADALREGYRFYSYGDAMLVF